MYASDDTANDIGILNYFFCRINRSRAFGLDKRWLMMVDLEQREKSRRIDQLNKKDQKVNNLT